MKTLLFGLLLSFNALAGITVISDFDDTIKISHAGNIAASTTHLLSDQTYTGMPEFLRAARSYSDALHIVTAGPKLVETTVSRLLRHNDITVDSLNFRNVGHEGKLEFKVKKIVEIMGQSSDDVILLGDDVDLDPEVFTEVKKRLGSRVLATYVHVVKNRQIPEGHTRYFTVLDLALRENLAGRLDAAGVSDVIASLNAEKKLSHVFPGFAYCPTDTVIWDWQLSTKFAGEAQDLGRKLTGFCQKGNSK